MALRLLRAAPGPRKFVGRVVSTKMNKSIVVDVERFVPHPRYEKYVKRNKKFMAHDELELAKEGDIVQIVTCRPISKNKAFNLIDFIRTFDGRELATPPPPLKPLVRDPEKRKVRFEKAAKRKEDKKKRREYEARMLEEDKLYDL
ncbi:30S ribosomal protein S17 [Hondaea fermentalgiana]|uniref:Small ribosomal subunit protein uS17c n=1 Tax=Hondaea fermentalgiana TaxID=2315210 RepID=A0A2R5GBP5_9STRA|nr:30S ribosomal protein S17 [Hondaea fermentalgiana]|eukprot:GBG28005.1 30S ribosomal protein S17 [Hondaea fermentalgiana]